MKLIHVTRNSPNWIDLEKDYDSHQVNETIKSNMKKIFKQWNKTIKPNYFFFRDKITKIAKQNHKNVKADIYFDSAFNIQNELKNYKDKYVVLFTDDDDWNHPNIYEFVVNAYLENPDLDAIQWNHCAFCSNFKHFNEHHKKPYFILTNNDSFHTNNYMLTNNFFEKFDSLEDVRLLNYGKDYDIYYGHTNIDNFFKERMNFLKIDNCLSVASKTISSYSYWWENDSSKLLDIIRVCSMGELEQIPKQVNWAEHEILETLQTYKLLTPIRIM